MRFVLLNISPLVGPVVRFVLLNISPLVGPVVRFVLLNISPLVGSLGRFVLHLKPVWYCPIVLHLKPVRCYPTFLHPKPRWYCPAFLQHVLCLSSLSFHHTTTCLMGRGPRQRVICGGVSLEKSSRVFKWISGLVQLRQWCICSSTVLGHPFEEKWPPLSLGTKVYAPRLHLAMETGR